MEKSHNGWVTLGSRNRGRRQRRRKTSQQLEQNLQSSSNLQKSKQSANTPPPMAFPASERKVPGKPTFTKEEKEISKILNRALEISAKRALEPMPRQVDPIPTHRSPMAVKTRDFPKKSFWKKGKTQDSKNIKKGPLTDQASCGSSVVSDSTSHSEVSTNNSTTKKGTTLEKIKIEWIFEQKPKLGNEAGKGSAATSTTPNATQETKLEPSWPKLKKAASMPNLLNPNAPCFQADIRNLNPNAPCFQANPFAQRTTSFKSFTPRAPSTLSWQHMSPQNIMSQWRGDYPMFNSFNCLPPQIQHNGLHKNDNRDSVSNLLLPYSCAPF